MYNKTINECELKINLLEVVPIISIRLEIGIVYCLVFIQVLSIKNLFSIMVVKYLIISCSIENTFCWRYVVLKEWHYLYNRNDKYHTVRRLMENNLNSFKLVINIPSVRGRRIHLKPAPPREHTLKYVHISVSV